MDDITLLAISNGKKTIHIPFLGLEALDDFTMRYRDKSDLLNNLFAMLGLKHGNCPYRVEVIYEYVNRSGETRRFLFNVLYMKDNFVKEDLWQSFSQYILNDQTRIRNCPIKSFKAGAVLDYLHDGKELKKYDIDYVCNKYLKNAPYRVYRKVYGLICDKVYVHMHSSMPKGNCSVNRDLSRFDMNDEYSYLALKDSDDEEEYAYKRDELSKIDIDEVSRVAKNKFFGLFDGVNSMNYNLIDVYDLEEATGAKIEDIAEHVNNELKSGRKR